MIELVTRDLLCYRNVVQNYVELAKHFKLHHGGQITVKEYYEKHVTKEEKAALSSASADGAGSGADDDSSQEPRPPMRQQKHGSFSHQPSTSATNRPASSGSTLPPMPALKAMPTLKPRPGFTPQHPRSAGTNFPPTMRQHTPPSSLSSNQV